MPPQGKRGIQFDSSDGQNRISAFFYEDKSVKPFCILQISHGMCEHMARYDDFAFFLAKSGVVVCGSNHIGHGPTSAEDDLGYFGEKGGRRFAIGDLKTLNGIARQQYPGLPLVLLGHSMGSFFARKYAVLWPNTIDGLILSGTGGPNPAAPIGMLLTQLIARFKGPRHRPKFIHNLAFGTYLKRIPNPRTPFDWISRDDAIVDAYAADPYCTFRFTANGFGELFGALRDVSSKKWAAAVPKALPLMIFSGDADPVGAYGSGVQKLLGWLKDAGKQNITYKMYPGGRHEMLNETNRAEVYADVLAFLRQWYGNNPR